MLLVRKKLCASSRKEICIFSQACDLILGGLCIILRKCVTVCQVILSTECPNLHCCVAFLIEGSACYCPLIPVFLQGILTCWHMILKYILHNPIFLANTTACLILYEKAKTCFVSVVCKITFRQFHATHWHSKGKKKDVFLQLWQTGCYLVEGSVMPFAMLSMFVAHICTAAEKGLLYFLAEICHS